MPTAEPTPVNFDEFFAADLEANVKNAVVVPFDLFGRTWHATNSASVTRLLRAMDGKEIMDYITSLVIPTEQPEFQAALDNTRGFDFPMVERLATKLSELLVGNPTEQSSGSSATSASPASSRRSTASSSSRGAKAAS